MGLPAGNGNRFHVRRFRICFPVSRSLGEKNWETERHRARSCHLVSAASRENGLRWTKSLDSIWTPQSMRASQGRLASPRKRSELYGFEWWARQNSNL